MKSVLFCQNPYAFGILEPIMEVLEQNNYPFLWFVTESILDKFPFKNKPFTTTISVVKDFNSDAIFVPGNEVPYYLRGLKVQIFHGLAGEKKGHFRIRHYFDLYLTQGPYFTNGFKKLREKYKNFDVIETGWPKLDVFGKDRNKYNSEKQQFLSQNNAKKIILFAPTFSPSLTSAPFLISELEELSSNKNYFILIKFHDLMEQNVVNKYIEVSKKHTNIKVETERNITKFLLMADLLISDTSSVVYEFLLLDKPVITFKSNSKIIKWDNYLNYSNLNDSVIKNLEQDPFKSKRLEIFEDYHPYSDGKSAERMVETVENYIELNGVPEKRKLGFFRRRKINKLFGKL
jgi:CDP-glycerol glycerophosphotransferase (TagB/SpsB family)